MTNDYKRATIVVNPKIGLEFEIEGNGPVILTAGEFRKLSIAAHEMLKGHAASCWQDKTKQGSYIRAIKKQKICKVKCTKQMPAMKTKYYPLCF